jgi:O-antigen/teichoic acid export membrane protein
VTTSSIVNTVALGAPEFLIGKLQGMAAAGLYSRANGLVAMFARLLTDAVYSVALSLFAREARDSHGSSESFLRIVFYTTALSGSFAAGLIFLAYPAVRFLYGPQWDASVDPTRILAIATVPGSIIPICSAALLGTGAIKRVLAATMFSAGIALALAALGAWHGIESLAAAVAAATILSSIIWLKSVQSVIGFNWQSLRAGLSKSGIVAMTVSIGPALSFIAFGARPESYILPLLLGVSSGVCGLLLGLKISRHPLCDEVGRIAPAVGALFGWTVTRKP